MDTFQLVASLIASESGYTGLVERSDTFARLGVNSLQAIEIKMMLEDTLGLRLRADLLDMHGPDTTVGDVCHHVDLKLQEKKHA